MHLRQTVVHIEKVNEFKLVESLRKYNDILLITRESKILDCRLNGPSELILRSGDDEDVCAQ